jgi:glucose/mannose-6-phosphate isomerase
MINLDDRKIYSQYDPDNMLQHLHNFSGLCEQAWKISQSFVIPKDYLKINKIVILGMGGSAIGGDLVANLAMPESKIPILSCRDYNLPPFVDADTLVIASSYSGLTEETLSAFEQAVKIPCKKLAITTGGKLKTLCESKGIPMINFDYKSSPRAALPFSFFILLGLLQNLNILKDKSGDVTRTILDLNALASKINEDVPVNQNKAKVMAQSLYGSLVLIYGAGLTSEVAHRWKTQINENAKNTAYFEIFPELNHNAIMGYRFPEEITHNTRVIILDSDLINARVKIRMQVTRKLLDEAGIKYEVLKAEGKSILSQMMTLILLGDYVSFYLALLNKADPTEIKSINYLKDTLAKN